MKLTYSNLKAYVASKTCPIYRELKPEPDTSLMLSRVTGVALPKVKHMLDQYVKIGIVDRNVARPVYYSKNHPGLIASIVSVESAIEKAVDSTTVSLSHNEWCELLLFAAKTKRNAQHMAIWNMLDGITQISEIARRLPMHSQYIHLILRGFMKHKLATVNEYGRYVKIKNIIDVVEA